MVPNHEKLSAQQMLDSSVKFTDVDDLGPDNLDVLGSGFGFAKLHRENENRQSDGTLNDFTELQVEQNTRSVFVQRSSSPPKWVARLIRFTLLVTFFSFFVISFIVVADAN